MWIEIIGWIGSVMVLLAYGLNINKMLASDALLYYLLNIGGSACLVLNTLVHHAIPSAVVNIIWVFIATTALARNAGRGRRGKATSHKPEAASGEGQATSGEEKGQATSREGKGQATSGEATE
jgi:hypothetical protein